MQVTREDLNPCTVKLDIVLESNEVAAGFESAYRHLTKKVRVPGFRPGKAPRTMLEPLLGVEEWNDQAAEELVRKAYPKALLDENLEIDRTTLPHITVNTIDKAEKKFEFTVKVPLPPKVELGEYKGMPVVQPSAEVTDDEIEFEIEELRKTRRSTVLVSDRGIGEGDVAFLNLKAEGAEGEGKPMVVLVGQNFPGLDEAIQGMRVEELKNVELSFPEDFEEKDLAGKTQKVQITVNSVTGVSLPVLDDAFAQSMKVDNVEDLRNRVREAVGQAKLGMVRQIATERLVDELMTRSQVAVSDNMWENLASRRLNELAQEQGQQGKSLQEYVEQNGMSLDEFTAAWREKAKLEVERALLIQSVYGKEGMQIDNMDLNLELKTMATEYRMEATDLLEELRRNDSLEELHFRALTRKVGDFLLSSALVTIGDDVPANTEKEGDAPAEEVKEAPKKKATKKAAAATTEAEAEPAEEATAEPKPKKKAAKKTEE